MSGIGMTRTSYSGGGTSPKLRSASLPATNRWAASASYLHHRTPTTTTTGTRNRPTFPNEESVAASTPVMSTRAMTRHLGLCFIGRIVAAYPAQIDTCGAGAYRLAITLSPVTESTTRNPTMPAAYSR